MNSACTSRTNASEVTPKQPPIQLTRKLWAAMVDVNNAVNTMVTPRTDMEIWGKEEVWSYPDRVGDCEDYVLEKRRDLMQLGVPAGSLLITVVRQPNGDGHAVLTVRTSNGDYILDNLEPRILDLGGHRLHLPEAPVGAQFGRLGGDRRRPQRRGGFG